MDKVKLRYCGNSQDPRNGNDEKCLVFHHNTSLEVELAHHRTWIRGMLIGDPQPCQAGSVEEMKAMGYVGLYHTQEDEYGKKHPECVVDYDGPLVGWVGQGWMEITEVTSEWEGQKSSQCPDCKGSGQYVSFTTVSKCQRCNGRGK